MKHSFHELIGNIISKNITGKTIRVLKDPACEPEGHVLPLFYSKGKPREEVFANVDLLVLKKNEIKVIIEIEESNFEPIHIFGKFFAAAFSSLYSHYTEDQDFIAMADSVLFIQILDTSKLKKDKTSKIKQWENIERSIRRIIPVERSKIDEYRLFHGDSSEFGVNGEKRKNLLSAFENF